MLEKCRAYIIAQSEPQNRSLLRLTERAGFGSVSVVFGDRAAAVESDGSDVVYFFVHHLLPDSAMRSVLRRIRDSEEPSLRYAPVFLVIHDCPFETVLKYIRLGYDDILSLPEKREVIVNRLKAQLNSEHLYIQTDDYLGPDRRRMEFPGSPVDPQRRLESPHERLHINRSVEDGVRVMRHEIIGRATPAGAVRPQVMNAVRATGRLQPLGRSA